MNKTAIATFENIGDIVDLRVEMQIFLVIRMNLHN